MSGNDLPPDPIATVKRFVSDLRLKGPILLAVSGGGDSLALALAMALAFPDGTPPFCAAIIDHALREGSANDAAATKQLLATWGIEATTLARRGPAPETGLQAFARDARHRLLGEHAHDIGAGVIALGHNREDQAETIAFRLARGSGPFGLAGLSPLSPSPVWPEGRGVLLARPFLAHARANLRQFLASHGVRWIDDPANDASRFARVRIRRLLTQIDFDTGAIDRLIALGAGAMELGKARAEATSALVAHLRWQSDHSAQMSEEVLVRFAPVVVEHALAALAAAIGGVVRVPAPDSTARLRSRLLCANAATLGGAVFRRSGSTITVQKMPARGGGHEVPAERFAKQRFCGLIGDLEGFSSPDQ